MMFFRNHINLSTSTNMEKSETLCNFKDLFWLTSLGMLLNVTLMSCRLQCHSHKKNLLKTEKKETLNSVCNPCLC